MTEMRIIFIILCTICACLNLAVLFKSKSKSDTCFSGILLAINVAAVALNSKVLIDG